MASETHKAMPVHGYSDQPDAKVQEVNHNKVIEERLLRRIQYLMAMPGCDPRWLSIARTHFEEGFMAMNRAVFNPARISLPDDEPAA